MEEPIIFEFEVNEHVFVSDPLINGQWNRGIILECDKKKKVYKVQRTLLFDKGRLFPAKAIRPLDYIEPKK
tara:strand:- start:216 stop:428 length:213 start_codon:yes stop_codon:yes gene_type:complete